MSPTISGKPITTTRNSIDREQEASVMQKRDIQTIISVCLWMLTLSLSAAISIFIIIVAAITAYHW